jgi:hypothetical protein
MFPPVPPSLSPSLPPSLLPSLLPLPVARREPFMLSLRSCNENFGPC